MLLSDTGMHTSISEKCAHSGGKLITIDEAAAAKPDVIFSALPHLKSAVLCTPFLENGVVIDLSADFRIRDSRVFEIAYGKPRPAPEYQEKAVYGLCEIYGKEVETADLIANPGCYPTATLLPLVPLLKEGVLEGKIIVNALSGISGAGKKAKENLIFCSRTENVNAYSPGTSHRHCQEIQQEVDAALSDRGTNSVSFTPHLVPIKRGMAVTTAATLKAGTGAEKVSELLVKAYENSPFIKLRGGAIPETGDVWGSNRCDIGWHVEGDNLLLFSVIDNLMKGASGQAVQNMNIRFGFDETCGLPLHGEL